MVTEKVTGDARMRGIDVPWGSPMRVIAKDMSICRKHHVQRLFKGI